MPLFRILITISISMFFMLAPVNTAWAQNDAADLSNQNCLTCHAEINQYYANSVHKDFSCLACHANISSDHLSGTVEATETGDTTPVSPPKVPETCGACHNQELNSYMESVHGRGLLLGAIETANCIDCHGSHNAMEVASSESTVSKSDLPATCGKCHEEPRANYAAGSEHLSYANAGTAEYYTFKFFVWLTILTVIGLILHMEMELLYLFKAARRKNGIAQKGGESCG